MDNNPILVLGARGKTGRRVAQQLAAQGRPVRAVSRSTHPRFDWEDPGTWAPVLEGVHSAYVSFQPDLAMPGATATVAKFFEQARQSGVKHLVLLSGRGEPEAEEAELALRDSGVDWTILRASWFFQNFSEGFLGEALLSGELALPVGDVREPFVDADDIADVAVAALTQPGHSRQLYELTGPQAISFETAVAGIAQARGRAIRFRRISPEDFREGLLQAQVPADVVDLMLYLCATVLDGRNTPTAPGVELALGRAPRDFAAYLQKATAPAHFQG